VKHSLLETPNKNDGQRRLTFLHRESRSTRSVSTSLETRTIRHATSYTIHSQCQKNWTFLREENTTLAHSRERTSYRSWGLVCVIMYYCVIILLLYTLFLVRYLSRTFLDCEYDLLGEMRATTSLSKLKTNLRNATHTLFLVRFLSRTFLDCDYDLFGEMRATTSLSKLKTNLRNATQT
jgi:hypothetical protein